MSAEGSVNAGDAAAVAAAAAATAAASKPWYDGMSVEDVGYIQNRGLDKLDAKAAFLNAATAHREAEKGIGIPTDRRLLMPKDTNDTAAWAAVNAKLGVPADAKEYDFTTAKRADGKDVDAKLLDSLRPVLQAAHVSKADAPSVVKALATYLDGAETGNAAAKAETLAAEKVALGIKWGSNVEANTVIARNTVATLGIKQEAVDALEGQIGYAAVFEMFRDIGARIGEDTFLRSALPGGNNAPMTGEGAEAALTEKMGDLDFGRRLQAGDASARKEFDNLTRMVSQFRSASR